MGHIANIGALPAVVLLAALASLPARAELHVSTSQALAAAVEKPEPAYNPLARKMKVTGMVTVEVKIAPDGTVADVKPVAGNVLLSASVLKTVKVWKFKPFEQDGKPTVASATLRFSFK
ncbi:MAG: energy transducer TonB [Bryobacteraceae bacterium]